MSDRPIIEYPLLYPFKVMGYTHGLRAHVKALFEATLSVELREEDVQEVASRTGKYTSLTVQVWLENEEQRHRMYAVLHADVRVTYYL